MKTWRRPRAVKRWPGFTADREVATLTFILSCVWAVIGVALGNSWGVLGAVAGGALGVAISLGIAVFMTGAPLPRPGRTAVGSYVGEFNLLDQRLEELRARAEENPELVVQVGHAVLTVRTSLVEVCKMLASDSGRHELGERDCAEAETRVDGEFKRVHAVISEAVTTLDEEKSLAVRDAHPVLRTLEGGALERVSADLRVRREAIKEVKAL